MNIMLAQQMVSLEQEDRALIEDLYASGEIPSPDYHPRVRALHRANAQRLGMVLDVHGWPGVTNVGEEACQAAWRIAMNAVFDLAFMERCCQELLQAVAHGQARGWQLAYLEDRIRVLSGQSQRYGTQFEIAEDGWPTPSPIEDPERVDRRRAALGLEPLSERMSRLSAGIAATGRGSLRRSA